jgi:hypothetical protein
MLIFMDSVVNQYLETNYGQLSYIQFHFHDNMAKVIHICEKKNSVVLVRKGTIPTEWPQAIGEVSANFSW